ncbi:MAG: NTP transferase domain-containing protein [Candidatus Schekmanbacteria bacterium]|nr:NTP transferase domain-containing protein [Candidatus Schekmanbacteria bacterium]
MSDNRRVLSVILGGGRGNRLYPLTRMRSKPAVPIGGKYRLIDIPISNCINSGLYEIAILTQFNSVSLHRHITQSYNFDVFHRGWIQIWAAEQTTQSSDWYQGTADAVRKQLVEIESSDATDVLILAGDHLYRMDYAKMLAQHFRDSADITVGAYPVPEADASRFGLLQCDDRGRITAFVEKTRDPAVLERFVCRRGLDRPYQGSMGIYAFKTAMLRKLLEDRSIDDFGADLIPRAIDTLDVRAHEFSGYWEDIGTMRAFYEANLLMAAHNPPFSFYDNQQPIYTRPRFLPGSIVTSSTLDGVLLADGCRVINSSVTSSIIGLRSHVGHGCRIRNCVVMGADYYESEDSHRMPVRLGTGPCCDIEGAIIDKNARIGANVRIRPFPLGTEVNGDAWCVRDGIVVVAKDAIIEPETVIEP